MQSLGRWASVTLLEYSSCPFSAVDEQALLCKIGQCSAQATAEALALMLSIRIFGDRFSAAPCKLQLRSDSVAALATAGRLAAASPVFNFLGAEITMDLELFEYWRQ